MVAKLDLTGQKYGRLLVLHEHTPSVGRVRWVCRCDCGAEKSVSTNALRSGASKSCGCLVPEVSRARAKRDAIGGYKGYAKYKTLDDYLAHTVASGACMLWAGPTYKNGYAKFPKNSRIATELGHRAVFMLANGYLPPVVMHTCDTPQCINPAHLRPGTTALNIADRIHKKRDLHMRKLTEDDVRAIRAANTAGQSAYSLGKQYGVAKQTVLSIIHRRIWSHI